MTIFFFFWSPPKIKNIYIFGFAGEGVGTEGFGEGFEGAIGRDGGSSADRNTTQKLPKREVTVYGSTGLQKK